MSIKHVKIVYFIFCKGLHGHSNIIIMVFLQEVFQAAEEVLKLVVIYIYIYKKPV